MSLNKDEQDFIDRRKDLNHLSLEQRLQFYHDQRGKRVPHAYITGSVEFFYTHLKVNEHCLIPRQETEVLVSELVDEIEQSKSVLDLCCGSGAIGLSLKKNRPDLRVSLSDISKKALEVAKDNANMHDLNVTFFQGDFLYPVNGVKFDYIICNPPYISESAYEALEKEVKDYEPKLALTAKENGLYFYKEIAKSGANFLNKSGKIIAEIGFDQKEDLEKIFESSPLKQVKVQKDYSGNDRFFFLEKR